MKEIRSGSHRSSEGQSLPADARLIGIRITNAVKCLPPENRPVAKEIANCAPYLVEELAVPLRIPAVWLDSRAALATALLRDGTAAEVSWRERVFCAVFEEGRDPGDRTVLERLWSDLGCAPAADEIGQERRPATIGAEADHAVVRRKSGFRGDQHEIRGQHQPHGAAGDDALHGGTGDDRLEGGRDDDGLFGDSGDDTLVGERGVTRLMVLEKLDQGQAAGALRNWFTKGIRKAPALKRSAYGI